MPPKPINSYASMHALQKPKTSVNVRRSNVLAYHVGHACRVAASPRLAEHHYYGTDASRARFN